jgi:hypothetical protein
VWPSQCSDVTSRAISFASQPSHLPVRPAEPPHAHFLCRSDALLTGRPAVAPLAEQASWWWPSLSARVRRDCQLVVGHRVSHLVQARPLRATFPLLSEPRRPRWQTWVKTHRSDDGEWTVGLPLIAAEVAALPKCLSALCQMQTSPQSLFSDRMNKPGDSTVVCATGSTTSRVGLIGVHSGELLCRSRRRTIQSWLITSP